MTLSTAWTGKKQTPNWAILSRISKNIVGKPTNIAGCGYGLESQGIHRNPKTVLRVMKKYGPFPEICRPKSGFRWAGSSTNKKHKNTGRIKMVILALYSFA